MGYRRKLLNNVETEIEKGDNFLAGIDMARSGEARDNFSLSRKRGEHSMRGNSLSW